MQPRIMLSAGILFIALFLFPNHATANKWTNCSLKYDDWCFSIALEGDTAWIGTRDEGVLKMNLNCQVLDTFTVADGLAYNWINSLIVGPDGTKWFGTPYGISKLSGTAWTTYNESNGLVYRYVTGIATDAQGVLWISTNGGVSRLIGTAWTNYTTANGLANNVVSCVAVDNKGAVWFGTDNPGGSGLSMLKGTTWKTYSTSDGLTDNAIYTIACDHLGNKWIGTFYGGISLYNDTTWKTFPVATEMNNYITGIAFDSIGNKWISTATGGVLKFDGTSWKAFTMTDGLLSDYVRAVAIDKYDNKWFGTRGGISKLEEVPTPVLPNANLKPGHYFLKSSGVSPSGLPILHFFLPRQSLLTLSVFNIQGQCLHILYKGILPEGDHSIMWNGRQNNGQRISKGCYLVKLDVAGTIVSGITMVLK